MGEYEDIYYSWQCPSCNEWLQDPLSVVATQCECGQSVFLSDPDNNGNRNAIKND